MKALLALALLLGSSAAHAEAQDATASTCTLVVTKEDGIPVPLPLIYKEVGVGKGFVLNGVISAVVYKNSSNQKLALSIFAHGQASTAYFDLESKSPALAIQLTETKERLSLSCSLK